MSSAPDSRRMPYELSDEEIQLYVSPLLDLGNYKPRNQSWIQRWALANSRLMEYDGREPVLVNGYRPPLDVQAILRAQLSPDVDGLMPRLHGDFSVRDTHFIVTAVPAGKPIDNSDDLPKLALSLLELDKTFRDQWGDKPLPEGIAKTSLDLKPLEKLAEDKTSVDSERVAEIIEVLSEFPLGKLAEYPTGLIHGDPGVDNAFLSDDGVVFTGGPGEVGPEIVDLAYLMQSASATIEDFDPEPTLKALAEHYGKPIEEFGYDMLMADISAHINIIGWFYRCSREFLPDYDDLYDHLLQERIGALASVLAV
ncbi:MAG: hypothetical protein ACP5G4_02960 [bacterium]